MHDAARFRHSCPPLAEDGRLDTRGASTPASLRDSNAPEPRGSEPGAAEAAASHPPAWRAILGGMGPRELLARLLQDDPLQLRRVAAERMAARAYLFDVDRLHLRSVAHVARYATRYRGSPRLEVWLREIVDQAMLDLLRDDVEAQRRERPPDPQDGTGMGDLARPLGLDPAAMRRACLAHNLLREPDRRAFHELLIAGRGLDELARETGVHAGEIAKRARRGLEAILIAAQAAPQETTGGGDGLEPDAGVADASQETPRSSSAHPSAKQETP